MKKRIGAALLAVVLSVSFFTVGVVNHNNAVANNGGYKLACDDTFPYKVFT